ncbi:calpain-2 catalytic subunit-like [Pomacea canaliculata]|uniref:calpain-2 catalytic subunit-like n=1 Tax=Pomacea canaliculata TaxID=400727 RepID=UPI000D72E0A4|nr:calpain-2 catalytic subunit-like [Pomacea canaliculata]XP_025093613.1 calpain-2 catalytic subunit-like [Pomacea canaliculata]
MTDYESIKRKCLQAGTLFEDPDFPANSSSLYHQAPWSTPLIEWKRPKEIVSDAQFIVDGALYVDLEQGTLGNCWFIAAAASLAASNKALIERVVPPNQGYGQDYAGIFLFNFWQYGKWQEVIVDDRLPTRDGQLVYTSSTRKNEFWCALLEKAFAKLYGCYEALDGGRVHDALLDMTGGVTELVDLRGSVSPDKIADLLMACEGMETIMGAGIFKRSSRSETKLSSGLYSEHAYSIIRLKTVTHKGQKKLLLLLRNPFGHGEWNGAWSDKHSTWDDLSPNERNDQAFNKRDDGEFWMSVQDFVQHFDELELCHLSPDLLTDKQRGMVVKKKWKQATFSGSWLRGVNAGGSPMSRTSRKFWTNPQYRVTLEGSVPSSMVISLIKVTGKLKQQTNDIAIGFAIFKIRPGKEPPSALTADNNYEHSELVDKSGSIWLFRERALHFTLDPGTYIIIPYTLVPDKEADFYLRIFTELSASAGPVEEPLGPTRETVEVAEDLIDVLFHKHQGPDGKVDARGVQKILAEANQKEFGKAEGYSLETCRCVIAFNDPYVTGLLDKEQVRKVWKDILAWKDAFKSADVSRDNTVDVTELKGLFQHIGFNLDTTALHRVVRRYGDREGRMHEDDFMQAICRILRAYRMFKKMSNGGKMMMDLQEWMVTTLYL